MDITTISKATNGGNGGLLEGQEENALFRREWEKSFRDALNTEHQGQDGDIQTSIQGNGKAAKLSEKGPLHNSEEGKLLSESNIENMQPNKTTTGSNEINEGQIQASTPLSSARYSSVAQYGNPKKSPADSYQVTSERYRSFRHSEPLETIIKKQLLEQKISHLIVRLNEQGESIIHIQAREYDQETISKLKRLMKDLNISIKELVINGQVYFDKKNDSPETIAKQPIICEL